MNLFEKYNSQGPRYTSYPPVPFWQGAPSESTWFSHLEDAWLSNDGIDLYIHVPFCRKSCFYCGCNREERNNHDLDKPYVDAVLREWNLYTRMLGKVKLASLHLGGGTPTFLGAREFEFLLDAVLNSSFADTSEIEASIELDPRTLTREYLHILKNFNFSRLSFGVQDFNGKVQEAIGRGQTEEDLFRSIDEAKKCGFENINFDLVYGLPFQNETTMRETVRKVIDLSPDRIAFYSYAHVPWVASKQKELDPILASLPQGSEKQKLFDLAFDMFLSASYVEIGMDHFVKKTDPLYVAMTNNSLYRNFMGYTNRRGASLVALGASSISSSGKSFIQNEKQVSRYLELMELDHLPITRGHVMSDQDVLIDELIQKIMCADSFFINGDVFKYDAKALTAFVEDGILIKDEDGPNHYVYSDMGRRFRRNVAMLFDPYLCNMNKQTQRFGQTV